MAAAEVLPPELELLVRAPSVSDLPFLLSIWSRELEKQPIGKAAGEGFRAIFHRWSRRILARMGCVALIACEPKNKETILGVCVYENSSDKVEPVLHFVYVRPEVRGFGIARRLTLHFTGKQCSFSNWKGLAYEPERLWDK
jgi:hypothetical protein